MNSTKLFLAALVFASSLTTYAQTNSYPLYSSGSTSGGSGDYTNITGAQLKLQSTSSFIRVPHVSADAAVSTVFNFESGKNVNWGEPSDAGSYLFRGRNLNVTEGRLGVGTTGPNAMLEIKGASSPFQHIFLSTTRPYGSSRNWSIATNWASEGDFSILESTTNTTNPSVFRFYIDGNGNIGAGTTVPGFRFHVRSGNANSDMMTLGSTSTGSFALTSADGGPFGLFGGVSNTGRAWLQAGRYDSNTAYDISLQAAGGNVGIGTTSPVYRMHVRNSSSVDRIVIQGTNPSDNVGFMIMNQDGSERWSIAAPYTTNMLQFYKGSYGNVMVLTDNGRVGIGTTSPDYPLTVNGSVHAKEVRVDLSVPGPDYVFEKEYKLTSLEDIRNYIDQNKHLPEVPSAKEMEKNGVQLGEMNLLLLKKIEELTLYLIDKDKEIQMLKTEVDKIKNNK